MDAWWELGSKTKPVKFWCALITFLAVLDLIFDYEESWGFARLKRRDQGNGSALESPSFLVRNHHWRRAPLLSMPEL